MLPVMLVAGLVGCSSDDAATDVPATTDASGTAAPALTVPVTSGVTTTERTAAPGSSAPTRSAPPADAATPTGFELVRATVTPVDGEVCDLCLWLATTGRERSRGLMGVTDLGDGDGMAFVYDAPHTGSFWMKNTLLPLSIAFFDADGGFLDASDMEPCEADPCPLYPTAPEFLVAIETTQGDLASLGIGAGSRLDLTDLPCD